MASYYVLRMICGQDITWSYSVLRVYMDNNGRFFFLLFLFLLEYADVMSDVKSICLNRISGSDEAAILPGYGIQSCNQTV